MSSLQSLSHSRLRHKVSEPKPLPEARAPRLFPLMCSLFPQTYDLVPTIQLSSYLSFQKVF